MGIIVKLVDQEPMIINGDAIAYAEGGNVLEVLNENEELLAAYRNWEYAMVQESEAEYQRSVLADLDDEEDEDLDDEDLEDEEDFDDEEEVTEELSPDEEEAVQRAREVMTRVIAREDVLSLEEAADQLMQKHADARARLSGEDGVPTN